MSIKQMPHGISSLNVVRVTPELFKAHSGQFLFMMQDYFKRSSDTSSDPISSFNTTRERLATDAKFMLLAHIIHDVPMGFLAADIIQDAARILIGYISNEVKPAAKNEILDKAMILFDEWAREKKCKNEIFYTHRAPGAHKLMVKRGWEYELSIYKREITNG